MDQPRASQPPPDLNDLVNALTQETAVDPALRAPLAPQMLIPRPLMMTRLLTVLAVLLIGGMAGLMVWLSGHVRALAADLRVHQQGATAIRLPPLPAADDLLDRDRFAVVLLKAPDQAPRLLAARGHLLLAKHLPVDAVAAFTEAAQRSDHPLSARDRLAWAAALVDSGEPRRARATVLGIDHATLSADELILAADLLTRCAQADR